MLWMVSENHSAFIYRFRIELDALVLLNKTGVSNLLSIKQTLTMYFQKINN